MKARFKPVALRRESWWLLGIAAVLLACIWPVRTLQQLHARQQILEQQRMQVHVLAQEARQLQQQIQPSAVLQPAALLQELVTQHLADRASVTVTGDAAAITLRGAAAAQFAALVVALRQQLHAQIGQLQLTQQDGLVNGQLELMLPEAR